MNPPFVSHNNDYVNYDGIMELWHDGKNKTGRGIA